MKWTRHPEPPQTVDPQTCAASKASRGVQGTAPALRHVVGGYLTLYALPASHGVRLMAQSEHWAQGHPLIHALDISLIAQIFQSIFKYRHFSTESTLHSLHYGKGQCSRPGSPAYITRYTNYEYKWWKGFDVAEAVVCGTHAGFVSILVRTGLQVVSTS